jgi:hypothetical protein
MEGGVWGLQSVLVWPGEGSPASQVPVRLKEWPLSIEMVKGMRPLS